MLYRDVGMLWDVGVTVTAHRKRCFQIECGDSRFWCFFTKTASMRSGGSVLKSGEFINCMRTELSQQHKVVTTYTPYYRSICWSKF
jgi:hypothetical protein